MQWINCEDRLPDDGINVLIHSPEWNDPVWIGWYETDEGWYFANGARIYLRITHWAEMPEGPKE